MLHKTNEKWLKIGFEKDPYLAEYWDGKFMTDNESEKDAALMSRLLYWLNGDIKTAISVFLSSPFVKQKDVEHTKKLTRDDYLLLTAKSVMPERFAEQDSKAYGLKKKNIQKSKFIPLNSITAENLQEMSLPPLYFVVDKLLPQGLCILASPPKYGKSWMVLDLCLAVAQGKEFLQRNTTESEVLYLALEDSHHRLQDRINKVLGGAKAPPKAHFSINAEGLSGNLIKQLEHFLMQYPSVKLIVIDTLQKVRDGAKKDNTLYGHDYKEIGILKEFADKHGICMLLVHHLRKSKDENDVFAQISGTYGILGAVDTALTLTRAEGENGDTLLSMTGRDIESNEEVLRFDKGSYKWHRVGSLEEIEKERKRETYKSNTIVKTVNKLLEENPEGWTGTSADIFKICIDTFGDECPAADPARLAKELNKLTSALRLYDKIEHIPPPKNGRGGSRPHTFKYIKLKK